MAAKKTNKVPTVRLNDRAKAKDAAQAEELKQARADARKARKEKEQMLPGVTARKYSKDVEAAIIAHDLAQASPKVHLPWTPIREKELDIESSAKSLAEYKANPMKGGTYNEYFIRLYTQNIEILTKELAVLKKAAKK